MGYSEISHPNFATRCQNVFVLFSAFLSNNVSNNHSVTLRRYAHIKKAKHLQFFEEFFIGFERSNFFTCNKFANGAPEVCLLKIYVGLK